MSLMFLLCLIYHRCNFAAGVIKAYSKVGGWSAAHYRNDLVLRHPLICTELRQIVFTF